MERKGLILIALSLIFTFISILPVLGQNPFIPKYDAVKRSERCFTVTWEANNQFGAVWWADQVDFSRDTLFNFVVYMGDRDGNGADGLAFVMHQDSRDTITDPSQQVIIGGAGTWDLQAATGDDGGGLGFAMHQSRVGPNTIPGPHGPGDDPENHKIQKSVAVEMDTWNNNDVPDGNNGTDGNGNAQVTSPYFGWDHAAVIYNGDIYGGQQVITDANGNSDRILPLKPGYAFGTANNPDGSPHHNIEDDRCYLFQIRWEVNPDGTQNLQLWADVYNGSTNTDGLQMVMTHTDDMINNVFGGDPVMRFGFTGSTGGAINEQTICLLGENLKPFAQDDYASIPMNTTTVVNVEANDNDPDGDQLHVPIIIDAARNGQATIFDSLDINYMRYTPNTNYVGVDTVGYVTCDVNSTKCYAKCDTAFVFIDVGCVPFDIAVNTLSANTVCSVTVPANGSAEAIISGSALAGTLWYEGFEDVSDGATSDNGTSAWSMTTSGSCNGSSIIQVESNRFRANRTVCEVIYETEVIDISGVSDVNISVDLSATGDMESDDYLQVYYILDGGTETALVNGLQTDNFNTATATISGLNGNNISIRIKAKNSGGDENYYWDNIHLTAIGAGTPNVSYYWYAGNIVSGSPVYTGAVHNTMNHGTYTVQAIDNNTGCPSNPYTVVMDSTGYKLSGGFIEQLSPFTNCQLPYDGALGAGIFNGTDTLTTGFTFEWYHQEDPKIPSFIQRTGHLAQNLESREYTVIISENATGCDTTINAEVPNAVSIPTVIATKIADVTSCTNPNSGIGEANVGGITAGYTFEWYAGPSIGGGPADYTGATINTLPVGTYTVQAIDGATSCPSDPATISIVDLTASPMLDVTVDSEQVSCDTLSPTGQLSGAVDESGTLTTAGYTFNWHKGPNDIIPARPGYTGGPTADGLEAGTYRLVVTEDATNCTSFIDTLIQDMTVNPADISLSTSDVSSCAVPNGSITVTVVGNPADYTYEVYRGNGVIIDSLVATSATNLIQNLDIGNYTVIAKDLITQCPTNPVFATINDVTVLPNANMIAQDQSSCDPGNPNGQLTANMGFGAITDYSYEWFEDNLSGTPITPSTADGEVISNLDSGVYAIRITNNTTQCENVFYPSVNLGIVLPVEVVSSTPSDFCGVNANGELIATVDGGLTEIDGYTFIWANDASGDTLVANTATVLSVEPGDYILTVINNSTACASNPAPITVDDITVTPIPTIAILDNSSCDAANPNGQLEVTNTNESPGYGLSDYTYGWFDQGTGNAIATIGGPNGEIANSLSAGNYELRIANNITSCSNSVLSQINDINIKPIIDGVSVTDATDCSDAFMSGANITGVNGNAIIPAGYTFEWTNLSGGPAITGTGSTINDVDLSDEVLPPGNYQVIAYNEYNCPSDPLTFIIRDLSVAPIFTIDATPNTSCSWIPSNTSTYANGTLSANYSGPNVVTDYTWERESPIGSGNWVAFGGNVATVNGLHELDNYRVLITDNHKCSSTNYASISKITDPNPFIDFVSVTDLTDCGSPNGELEAQVVIGNPPPAGFNFEYVLTGPVSGSQFDNGLFQNLPGGNYQVNVINTFTQCQSNTIDTAIHIDTDLQFTIIPTAPANCTGGPGQISISGQSNGGGNEPPATGPGFTYNWFIGNDKTTSVNPGNISTPDLWSSNASNLLPDNYLIEITDLSTSCTIDTIVFLPSNSVPLFLDPDITNSTQCIPGNGQVELEIDPTTFGIIPPATTANYSNYEYILFEGNSIDASWVGSGTTELDYIAAGVVAAAGPVIFTDLEPGVYTVIAREDFADNCFSHPITFTIGLNFSFDPLSLIEVVPDNTCATLTGNGQLNEVNNAFYTTGGKFEYTWYSGSDTSIPANIIEGPTSATKITPDTLRAGQYALFVEIVGVSPTIGLGCTTSSVIDLSKQIDELTIIDAPANPKTICSYGNGDIHIAEISENGTSLSGTGAYNNFLLYDHGFNEIGIANAGTGISGNPWNLLDSGTYYVTAQNPTTLCITDPLRVDINDVSQNPEITATVVSPDLSCNGILPTGILEALANGSNVVTDYSFEWRDPSTALVSDAPATYRASGLSANNGNVTYTITVVDISLDMINDGCTSSRDVTLLHQPTTVSILSSSVAQTDQTICAPNGELMITEVRETVAGVDNDYTFPFTQPPLPFAFDAELLNENLGTLSSNFTFDQASGSFLDNTGDIDSIPAGTYYVRAQNASNGCSYGPLTQVIIRDLSKNPVISATLLSPDYACLGGAHTGQLTAQGVGGSDADNVTTNFIWRWTQKSTGTPVPTAGMSYTAVDLWPDTYTITVTDIDGDDEYCSSSRDYVVNSARHLLAINATSTDQTICAPDGTIHINDVTVNGASVVDPHLSWNGFLYDNTNNAITPAPPESGFVNASITDPFANISANTYFVRAQDDATKCYSNAYQVIVRDLSVDPVIDIAIITPQYSLNPDPLSWTGVMQASVSEADGTIDTYNYDWYQGLSNGSIPFSSIDNVSLVDKGFYKFIAENTSTGCESEYYVYMPFVYLEPIFNTSIRPQTICSPNDGGIEVTDIELDATPDQLSDYTFNFHHDNYVQGDSPDQVIPGDDARTAYDDIDAGSYYIVARENWWWIESYPVKVEVIDSTTNPIITFDVTNYHAVTSCDEAVFADGALAVEVYEDNNNPYLTPPFTYDYSWYNGTDSNPANVIAGETTNAISGLPSGYYTISVVNLASNCVSEETFEIEDESTTPIVVAAQTPNTNCPIEIANGITTANVINSNNPYYYQWFEGTNAGTTPDYQGVTWRDLPIGYYTVVAIDQGLATCVSEPVTIKVEDGTENPVIVINELSPVTNCDPDRPNGVLTATTQDGIAGHTFEWFYEGNLYATGPMASDLGLFEYVVTVTNNVTQCQTTMSSGPSKLLSVVPPPDVDILNDRTSCLEPDGSASASISGNVVDYIFKYFNKFSGEELTNFYEDYTIYDLDTSTYLVTAESRITGCISDPSEFAIANESYFPEIDVIADPSNCQEPSGAANVIISDMTRDFKVTWYGDNGFETQEKEIVYIPVGKYRVEVEGTDGCITSTEAEVKGDIIIYNGVSANNDGLNEYFAIVCLEYFPNNNVKIYNRAGLLVYEQGFYDMNDPDKRFTGISNKGASVIGTELPIGTYFYVVDKNDGDKAKVGYLELNR